ncbi:ACT domain-containing protein [Gammaproteobacteria bacterium]|nr:ACT domain-containing protein [Gammaproteobacteria bacterium]MDA7786233.1 ACT domain-containing protein [Gammaproteobacteria bacterium]MDA8856706.1 ACT domain-containing protein [Gammaproteobacteria bacterium]MDB4829156.1 ACT domain-containing protein [Gammaproteobacteria bacterium]|tara:strand:+ start:6925 stop:7212 length:288 start_codon:yes stop_codon:yes gene_type:complete
MNKKNILIILENKPGALARIVGLFHQRGYNILSLHVDAVEDTSEFSWLENDLNIQLKPNEVSKMTISTKVSDALQTQILRQINKLIDVLYADEKK